MGFISRRLLPDCDTMCVCCPALRPSSRQPVKRYKKLLAEIFPKTLDGPPNERKIMKLCEYAVKNPFRIPKIAKFLEQRSYKELRSEHINFVRIITEAYSKLLYICKNQMAYFATSLLNVIFELLDSNQDAIQILGCQTLTRFIYNQADNTYARNIESLVRKVCMLACENQVEQTNLLRAVSLQCLSAMVWYMTEYSYIFSDFDEIIHATLENYGTDGHTENVGERHESHHNWVDEVVRSEARVGVLVGDELSLKNMTIRPRPEIMDFSALTREEQESPHVWSQICIQNIAEMAKESTTMRRILEPLFFFFDKGRHWASRNGLALSILSDMSYLVQSSGNEQLILSAVIRHLEHKNVVHDPRTKSDIVQVATYLVQQLRSHTVVAEIGIVSDLCRHLRKSLQASVESAGPQESNWNVSLQNSIEDCLLEIARGIGDAHPLFDMMAITLEKLPTVANVARATTGSLLILAHIISLTSIHIHSQLVFPEALLLQLIKTAMHPDVETRIVAHQIFSVILVRTPSHLSHKADYPYELRNLQSKPTSAFASAAALLDKLRREKECLTADKHGNDLHEAINVKDVGEEFKPNWVRKGSPYFYKLSCSVIDRTATATSSDGTVSTFQEASITILSDEQTAQLISAFWMQANLPDNLPSNFEAIAHSCSLTLLTSRIKNSNHRNTICFFQLLWSLMKASLDPTGILPPSCQRSLFTLASGMLAFAGKLYHIHELTDSLMCLISCDVDPYLRIGENLQICIKPHSNMKEYGSGNDQQMATSSLADFRNIIAETGQQMLDIIARGLSNFTDIEKEELTQLLSGTFIPEDGPLFCPNPVLDWVSVQALAASEESLSFDEDRSRRSSIDCDIISESPATDNLPSFKSRIPTLPSLPHVISVGQLLESALHVAGQVAGTSVSTSPLPYGTMASQCEALGMGMRKKLSSWLVAGHDPMPYDSLSSLPMDYQATNQKVDDYVCEQEGSQALESRLALRLPPASPFDNFMKAAGC